MNIESFKFNSSWKIFWGLITVGIISLIFSFSYGKKNISQPISKIAPTNLLPVTEVPSPMEDVIISTKPKATTSKTSVIITTPVPGNGSSNTNTSSGSTTQNSELQVSVSITGTGGFSLSMSPGSNHCDVLSKALSAGKINSLNMRFNSDIGSNAVYQINGLGKDNSVWWTYKINGQSPSQGCTFVKVNSNDKVEWNYIGS